MNYISKNLRFLRKRSNLTQEQFALKVNMNRGNIASYEKGSAEPSVEKLQRISQYFSVDLNFFIEQDLEGMHKERDENMNFNIHTASTSTASSKVIDNMLNNAQESLTQVNNSFQEKHLMKLIKNNSEVSNYQIITIQSINNNLQILTKDLKEMKELIKEIINLNKQHL